MSDRPALERRSATHFHRRQLLQPWRGLWRRHGLRDPITPSSCLPTLHQPLPAATSAEKKASRLIQGGGIGMAIGAA
jgi:hypothetical protein